MTYGCFRFIDSYRFLSCSLDSSDKRLDNDDFEIFFKKRSPWQMGTSK